MRISRVSFVLSVGSVGRDRFGPVSYEGFVDSEGFDGGDGQVGVVGDGECSPVLYLRSSTLG